MPRSERYEEGNRIRREINGDAVIDRILENTDEFGQPLQDLVTEYCWGEVWSRPQLDRRSRSILNIGMLAALNRPEALAGHIQAGITNGLSWDEIRECVLQIAISVGMPAGLSAMSVAQKVRAESGAAG